MAQPSRRPLDGVRVLELANFMAGPYCGMVLRQMETDGEKVEEAWR